MSASIHFQPWTPFVETIPVHSVTGRPVPRPSNVKVFGNSRYTVRMQRHDDATVEGSAALVHLSIHCHDRCARHDWRDLQRIKDELVGPECEGVELFPARSRLVDEANEFHLWVVDDPAWRFPFGFAESSVLDHDEMPHAGSKQRPLEG